MRFLLLNIRKAGWVLVLCAVNSFAATYFVTTSGSDSNSGAQASPWRTIGKAVAMLQPGDVVMVAAGDYGEKVSSVRSGTAGARITFKAQGKAVTKTFNINHNYITIDGFEMTGANDTYMMTWKGTFGELLNNTIHDTGASGGIVRAQGNNFTARGNRYYSSSGPGEDLTVFIADGGDNQLWESNEVGPGKDNDAFRA